MHKNLNKKASVPIGTIAIIIIVLIAGLGMWWYFTQRGQGCSDVKHHCDAYLVDGTCDHHSYTIKAGMSDNYVRVQWWETSNQWRVHAYIQSNGYITTFKWFGNPDELNEWVQAHYAFSDVQKVDTARMIHCIKAGCPSCEVT